MNGAVSGAINGTPLAGAYLEYVHMEAFGRMADKLVGPFAPGLNVVFGGNEAGKTTTSAFVEGVLFGWEDARGTKNVYKPTHGQRCGSLVFALGDGSRVQVSRSKNTDGLQIGDPRLSGLAQDVDRTTFHTMFNLNSAELLGLDGGSDVTSRLLTAESGTQQSPARAIEELDRRIGAYTTRSAKSETSLPRIRQQIASARDEVARLSCDVDLLWQQDRRLAELEAQKAQLEEESQYVLAQLTEANDVSARLSQIRERIQAQRQECVRLHDRMEGLRGGIRFVGDAGSAQDALAKVYKAQADLDRLEHAEGGLMQKLAQAKASLEAALCAVGPDENNAGNVGHIGFDASDDFDLEDLPEDTSKTPVPMVSVVLFTLGAVCGTAAAALLVSCILQPHALRAVLAGITAGFGVVCGIAAAHFARMRPNKRDCQSPGTSQSNQNAHVHQCEERVIRVTRELEEFRALLPGRFTQMGAEGCVSFAQAKRRLSTLRQEAEYGIEQEKRVVAAQAEMDGARQVLTQMGLAEEELIAQAKRYLERVQSQSAQAQPRHAQVQRPGNSSQVSIALEVHIQQLNLAWRGLLDQMGQVSQEAGSLQRDLMQARGSRDLEQARQHLEELKVRQQQYSWELAELLLAKRALTAAMEKWKSGAVPEVYARASELLSLMTDGEWVSVRLDESVESGERVVVANAAGLTRHPRLLSTGTRQQLYLALRIALLELVDSVGMALPVMADDILVNFDDQRRRGAALALAQLAKKRQVIVCTCHMEVVHLLEPHLGGTQVVAL